MGGWEGVRGGERCPERRFGSGPESTPDPWHPVRAAPVRAWRLSDGARAFRRGRFRPWAAVRAGKAVIALPGPGGPLHPVTAAPPRTRITRSGPGAGEWGRRYRPPRRTGAGCRRGASAADHGRPGPRRPSDEPSGAARHARLRPGIGAISTARGMPAEGPYATEHPARPVKLAGGGAASARAYARSASPVRPDAAVGQVRPGGSRREITSACLPASSRPGRRIIRDGPDRSPGAIRRTVVAGADMGARSRTGAAPPEHRRPEER